MKRTILIACSVILSALFIYSCGQETPISTSPQGTTLAKKGGEQGDPAVLAMMHDINDQLVAAGSNLFVNEIQFFTIGLGRPSNRILQQPFRWVPNDARRAAQGEDITHIVDQSFQGTISGVTAVATEAKIDASIATWDADQALNKVSLVKRVDPDVDISIFDEFFPGTNPDEPAFGNPFLGDIVNVGWYPRTYFEAVGGPGGGRGILAFSVTFIFTDDNGVPTDINGDNYLDTALNEVYYNDTFGDPNDDRVGNPWGCDIDLPGIDIQTVALHENGHSLGVGHFGPPPDAVMNPIYAGQRQSPFPIDHAGMNTVWSSWPNP